MQKPKYEIVHNRYLIAEERWSIENTRTGKVISFHQTIGEANREVQAILADEAHPNFSAG